MNKKRYSFRNFLAAAWRVPIARPTLRLALALHLIILVLPGAALAVEASSLFAPEGPSPRIGQSFLIMDPVATAGDGFTDRIDALLRRIQEHDSVE